MTEAQLLASVLELCAYLRYPAYHTHDSRRSAPGFPDLVILVVPAKKVLYRELKTDKGRISPAQQAWICDLFAAGADIDVWRTSDWSSGRILAELRGAA